MSYEEYVVIDNYNDGSRLSKDSVSDALINNTGEGCKVSTEEALANLCQVLADKALLGSKEFGQIIGLPDNNIWFGRDSDCPQ